MTEPGRAFSPCLSLPARGRWCWVELGVSLLGAAVGFAWWAPGSARYEGRKLCAWLRQAQSQNAREQLEAERVLRGVGPEAVPDLIRAVDAREPWG